MKRSSKQLLQTNVSRRHFVMGMAAGGTLLGLGINPQTALSKPANTKALSTLKGKVFDLTIDYLPVNFTGRERIATAVNGSIPAPVLRWQEGETVTLRVTNNLSVDSSIHWHGIILPPNMDGVPGLSFAGIKPGATFEYQFSVDQSGTYWYHSHSQFQEQTGLYGAIIIDPKEPEPFEFDREYIVQLSDWSDDSPELIYATLKKMSHYYNFRDRTVGDIWKDIVDKGLISTWKDRAMWNSMRMSDTDIADVNGYAYTFLMNGITPKEGWLGLFKAGEKIRLRFINSAAMTIFDVRIPGLKMTVVAADGQNIQPVEVDEFRIATAETYDVIVEPDGKQAYTIFAQSMDRTGFARGTLTPNEHLQSVIPAMDYAPTLTHNDMGMAASMGAAHGDMHHMNTPHQSDEIHHAATEFGPQTDMRVATAANGLHDPGVGLRDHQQRYGRRVLTYADLRNLYLSKKRAPTRDIILHLNGNMSRYIWTINGVKFADAEPIVLTYGERVRFTLINDTMMTHPMHLHGMWSELEVEDADYQPRKHTVIVQPASKIRFLVTADAIGQWAFHCHLLYHMPGMFRAVHVVKEGA